MTRDWMKTFPLLEQFVKMVRSEFTVLTCIERLHSQSGHGKSFKLRGKPPFRHQTTSAEASEAITTLGSPCLESLPCYRPSSASTALVLLLPYSKLKLETCAWPSNRNSSLSSEMLPGHQNQDQALFLPMSIRDHSTAGFLLPPTIHSSLWRVNS